MSGGRCAGCGMIDASCKKVRAHVTSCPLAIALYKSDPSKVLDPADELRRYKAEEGSDESLSDSKEERRQAKLAVRIADADQRRLDQTARWNPPGLLEE